MSGPVSKSFSSEVDTAIDLIHVGLAYDGERITEPGDLPDDLDELAALLRALMNIAAVTRRVREEVEGHMGALLGQGGKHRYGDHVLSWDLPWSWKIQSGASRFVVDVVRRDPSAVLDLFAVSSIRKTGVEKVAHRMGLDPETVVETVLRRERKPEPQIKWKYEPIQEDSNERDDHRT